MSEATPEQKAEAASMGWKDNRDTLPEGKTFVDAVEFMNRNPIFGKFKAQEQKISDMQETLSGVMAHNEKVNANNLKNQEKAWQEKVSELEAKKVQALDDSDHAAVVKIDKEIRAAEKPTKQEGGDPDFDKWVSENHWYMENEFLQAEMIALNQSGVYRGSGMSHMNKLKNHIMKKYPDEFDNPERHKHSPVESGGNFASDTPKEKLTAGDLTADEKREFNTFKNMGVFSKEGSQQQYLDDVQAMRG